MLTANARQCPVQRGSVSGSACICSFLRASAMLLLFLYLRHQPEFNFASVGLSVRVVAEKVAHEF